jgi:hypothetical protein
MKLEDDGNLTVQKREGVRLYTSNSGWHDSRIKRMWLYPDGNLALQTNEGATLWQTNKKAGIKDAVLIVQDDGDAVICSAAKIGREAIWSSKEQTASDPRHV